MTTRFVEEIYCDFLYDCYIANQRLTVEDWEFYGKEEHHLEIPARDGGILHPLNSQYLTTYQHWVAGVLQSEVNGKKSFAFIPKNVLPKMLEIMRAKWQKEPHRKGKSQRECLIRNNTLVKMQELGERIRDERVGIHDPQNVHIVREGCRLGGSIQGRSNVINGTGMFKRTSEELSEASKRNRSRKFRCLVTGKVSTDGGLTKIQRRLGIDTSLREQIN